MKDPVPRIALIAPTRTELRHPYRALRVAAQHVEGLFLAASGTLHRVDTVLARTGLGKENAAAAAEWIFDSFAVSEVLLAGFAGGIRPDLKTADLVACSEILGLTENGRLETSSALLERALKTGRIDATAPAVTVDHVARSVEEKRALGEAHGAAVVEMEGFPVLAESRRRGVPGLMVRAVLDPSDVDLPDATHLLTDAGEVRVVAWVRYVMTHPSSLAFFYELMGNVRACRVSMNRFIERYFSLYRKEQF